MTPSLEGWPNKAKEGPSLHEVRLAPLDTNPVFLDKPSNLVFSVLLHLLYLFVSISITCRNFIWIKNRIYITTSSQKFPNQWKKQTNSEVPPNTLALYKASSWKRWLNLCEKQSRLSILFVKFTNLMFILLENLVYYNNPIQQYYRTIQHTALNEMNIKN